MPVTHLLRILLILALLMGAMAPARAIQIQLPKSADLAKSLSDHMIGYAGGENVYSFGAGDPIQNVDPSGLDPTLAIRIFYRPGLSINYPALRRSIQDETGIPVVIESGLSGKVGHQGDEFWVNLDVNFNTAVVGSRGNKAATQPGYTAPTSSAIGSPAGATSKINYYSALKEFEGSATAKDIISKGLATREELFENYLWNVAKHEITTHALTSSPWEGTAIFSNKDSRPYVSTPASQNSFPHLWLQTQMETDPDRVRLIRKQLGW